MFVCFQSYAKNEGWDAFKSCVKQEMKAPVWKKTVYIINL
jgi:hypothetical protein